MIRKALCSMLAITVILFNVPLYAQDDPNPNAAASAKRKPSIPDEGTEGWISVSGRVTSTKNDSFVLDYGRGNVRVDMSEWNWERNKLPVSNGDRISVSGFMERNDLQARTIYVQDLNTHYYVDPSRKIDPVIYPQPGGTVDALADEPRLMVTGTVTQVDGREFTLEAGGRQFQVDTSQMRYNPLDRQGFQQVSKGDRVTVNGELDEGVFEGREIEAYSVISLNRDPGKSRSMQQEQRERRQRSG